MIGGVGQATQSGEEPACPGGTGPMGGALMAASEPAGHTKDRDVAAGAAVLLGVHGHRILETRPEDQSGARLIHQSEPTLAP